MLKTIKMSFIIIENLGLICIVLAIAYFSYDNILHTNAIANI